MGKGILRGRRGGRRGAAQIGVFSALALGRWAEAGLESTRRRTGGGGRERRGSLASTTVGEARKRQTGRVKLPGRPSGRKPVPQPKSAHVPKHAHSTPAPRPAPRADAR